MKSVSDFSFQFVKAPLSLQISANVIALWTESARLSVAEAERRLQELVLVLTYRTGAVIGVSTAVKTHFPQIHNYVYAYRCFIHPEYRAPALDTQMIVRTKNHLQELSERDAENKCVGIMVVVQNDILRNQWKQAVWQGADMIYVGNTPKGHHIRIGYFKGARI